MEYYIRYGSADMAQVADPILLEGKSKKKKKIY